jgi:hypothetical protein
VAPFGVASSWEGLLGEFGRIEIEGVGQTVDCREAGLRDRPAALQAATTEAVGRRSGEVRRQARRLLVSPPDSPCGHRCVIDRFKLCANM